MLPIPEKKKPKSLSEAKWRSEGFFTQALWNEEWGYIEDADRLFEMAAWYASFLNWRNWNKED